MGTEDTQRIQHFTINQLQNFQKIWTIKVKVLRLGSVDQYTNNKGPGEMLKVILLDEEGTRIQAVMFNNAVAKFRNIFIKDKIYLVSNGVVKHVNPKYPNVHKEYELSLTTYSTVEEIEGPPSSHQLSYNFIPFEDAFKRGTADEPFDIIGFVINVKKIVTLRKAAQGTSSQMREIIIKNKESESLAITLWADLAENEGHFLEGLLEDKPVIAISNGKGSIYDGQFRMTTTSITTIEVNPNMDMANEMRTWLSKYMKKGTSDRFLMIPKRITNATLVKLEDIMKGAPSTKELALCSFKATILNIENKDELWYDACTSCNSRVTVTEAMAECKKCNKPNVPFTQRYILKLKVLDGDQTAIVTMFNEAENFIGCPVKIFIESMNQDKTLCTYYRRLILRKGKIFLFLIKLRRLSEIDRAIGRFVAEEFEEIEESDTEQAENSQTSKGKKARVA